MSKDHNVQRCRWAEPTLFLEAPYWLEAWDSPWSCRCEDGGYRPLADTRECPTCQRWEARRQDSVARFGK